MPTTTISDRLSAWRGRPPGGLAGKAVGRRKNGTARGIPDQLRRFLHADDFPGPSHIESECHIDTHHRTQYRPRPAELDRAIARNGSYSKLAGYPGRDRQRPPQPLYRALVFWLSA